MLRTQIQLREDQSDAKHKLAGAIWVRLLNEKARRLVSTNHVLLESIPLIQRRLGITQVQTFQAGMTSILQVTSVEQALHDIGVDMLLAANRCHSLGELRQFCSNAADGGQPLLHV